MLSLADMPAIVPMKRSDDTEEIAFACDPSDVNPPGPLAHARSLAAAISLTAVSSRRHEPERVERGRSAYA